MAEYIERDALMQRMGEFFSPVNTVEQALMLNHTLKVINAFPAADVVEVVHGRWIGLEYDGYADGCPVYDLWECSECGEEVRGEDVPDTHPWCHGCGAKMDVTDINVGGKGGEA